MSSPEERVRAGRVALALDTNAMYMARKRLLDLCTQVNRLNEGPDALHLRLCVPAVVHMEMLLDIRQNLLKKNAPYDAVAIDRGLQDKGLHVVAFEKPHAEQAAERIAGMFPDTAAWREAKRKRYVQALGLTDSDDLKKAGKRCSATVDWLIAAQSIQEDWILVTNDQGIEFSEMQHKMRLEDLERLLTDLLAPRNGA